MALHSTLAMLHIVTLDRGKIKRSSQNKKKVKLSLTEEIVLFNEEVDQQGNSYSEVTLTLLIRYNLGTFLFDTHGKAKVGPIHWKPIFSLKKVNTNLLS